MTAKTSRTRQGLEAGRRGLVEAAIAETYRGREDPVLAAHHEHLSRFYGGLAADSFAASGPAADIQHGEVMPTGDTNKALGLRDTLRTPDMPALDASIARTDLLLTANLDVAALAIDAADSIDAGNSLEKMLAHQAAAAHATAFRFLDKAAGYLDRAGYSHGSSAPVEAARLTNAACRLMDAYRQALLTLQRIRTGGAQTVTVQHVHVGEGAQAVIGNVQAAGGLPPGGKKK